MSNLIECHTCGDRVKLARSVKLRRCIESAGRFTGDPDLWPERQRREFAQYEKEMVYRRAFICEPCYKRIDSRSGTGEIYHAGGAMTFGLAGPSRSGRAAIYNFAKWLRLQRKQAAEMGIECDGGGT